MRILGAASSAIAAATASRAQHAKTGPVGEQVEEGEEHRYLRELCVSSKWKDNMQAADERSQHRLLHSEQSLLRPFTEKFPKPASSFQVLSQASVGTPGITGGIKTCEKLIVDISHE
jgi:hypothetical protein